MRILRLGSRDAALARRAVAVNGTIGPGTPGLRRFLADGDCILLAAVEEGTPVGALWGFLLERPEGPRHMALLYSVDVRADRRRRGVGRALVLAFDRIRRRAGASKAWVVTNDSNRGAMALYRSTGARRRTRDDVVFEYGARRGPRRARS